jgi:type II secretory pathway pseudopilin PulG
MKKILFLVVIVLIAAAYLAGYWPQHQRLVSLETRVRQANQQLAQAQSVARLCSLQNRLLGLIAQTESGNYGDAQKASTEFFDQVRAETMRNNKAGYTPALEAILGTRDTVTAGLARKDPTTLDVLRQALTRLHQVIEQQTSMPGQ